MPRLCTFFAVATLLLPCSGFAQQAPPDTIFFHGDILTGAGLSGGPVNTPSARVSALAIRDGRIVRGGDDSSILALKGPHTELIDLDGHFAMPGFNDAHTHIAYAGQQRLTLDLDGTTSLSDMQSRITAYVAHATPGQWILGGGWDHTKWTSKMLPTRQDLDSVTAGHPALLVRTDGHIAVANSAALEAAHITSSSVVPAGSKIDLDASGAPTGIIREEAALALIQKVILKPDAEVRRKALQLSIDDALAHGVTSIQDFSDWDDFLALEAIERDAAAHNGTLPLRVSEWLTFNDPVDVLKQHQASHPASDPYLHTGMLKGFMDGSLGSRTAALLAPYSDDPSNSGLPRYDQKQLDAMTTERAIAGFPIGFHAIGDRANSMALTAFEHAQTGTKPSVSVTPRYRIEHAQVLDPKDFDRFARLHVIASMQPSHLLTDMAWAGDRLGPERVKYAYAWRSFLDHHVVLAFGTDYPVESISPFRGLYAAITRQNEAGTASFQSQERITLNEALFAYTQGSAFAESAEKQKGRLEPGFLADLVVLDRDITKATPQELLHARVLRTVVGGQTRYLARD
ncbi:amidohydrolase [Granulicella sp. S156]|uniref:amidohydrolase n=1 Tax=Granulicella sp. S156 TaxID=1747224 RepID=UPI00131D98F8|nr:amidohydrolase [Granulicella sp. S156]